MGRGLHRGLRVAPRGSARALRLDDYGATNVAEFFAVATESFFDAPVSLQSTNQACTRSCSDFYQQNPADRVHV